MKTIQSILGVTIAIIILSSCNGKERFVESREISIWNYDTIPIEIFINNNKAIEFNGFFGEVHLNSGEYEIIAKSKGKEINKINISLDRKAESNEYDRIVFLVGDNRSFALLNMQKLYDGETDLDVEEKFYNTNIIEIETNTYHIYWPWSTLPKSIYSYGNSADEIFQLFELPKDYQNKSDEEIETYCYSLIK